MPELPEVENALRDLTPFLQGRVVTRAQINWERTLATPPIEHFTQRMLDQQFARFTRRGKYMLLGLESGATLIVHLRMTGKLFVQGAQEDAPSVSASTASAPAVDPHIHVEFDLDNGARLLFRDPRKFGRVWLVDDVESVVGKLGFEPWDPAFTPEVLQARLHRRTASIKALLLDQTICAGIGNIYADEALFAAQILPMRAGGTLALPEIVRLHAAIQDVLARAITSGGSSLGASSTNYVRPGGEAGTFQQAHQVFRRTDKPCLRCGAPILRIALAQRSTHYCAVCQF